MKLFLGTISCKNIFIATKGQKENTCFIDLQHVNSVPISLKTQLNFEKVF
jgi:hypothetical protein